MDFTDDQRLFLQAICDHFLTQGTWPKYKVVERSIMRTRHDFDMRAVSKSLPEGFASAFGVNGMRDSEATLSVEALRELPDTASVLADFLRVLRYCIDRVFEAEEEYVVTSEEVQQALQLSELSTRQVGHLLLEELLRYSGGMGGVPGEGAWTYTLRQGLEGLAQFDHVTTLEEYIQKKNQWRTGASTPFPSPAGGFGTMSQGVERAAITQLHPPPLTIYTEVLHMGDYYDHVTNSTIVNRSLVQQSFNKVQSDYGDETAQALMRVAEEVERSGSPEAAELLDGFNEELQKSVPKRALLRTCWEGLVQAVPTLVQLTDVTTNIAKLFLSPHS